MRPSTFTAQTAARYTSTGTSDTKTIVLPANCSAFTVSCETTNGRLSFDGSDPAAVGNASPIIYAGLPPQLCLIKPGDNTLLWVSTAGANAVLIVVPGL